MPLGDIQFWIVTLIALGALTLIVRTLLPRKPKGTKTTLTIEREELKK